MSEELKEIIRIRASEDRDKPRANRFAYYESFKNWIIFQIREDAEYGTCCDLYRELAGMEET